MTRNLFLRPAVILLAVLGLAGCNDDGDDVTSTRGSLAAVEVEAPGTVQSGVTFDAPLSIVSVDPSSGTTATITGNRVVWNLGTLDANTRSRLAVRARGTLAAGGSSRTATIRAELTGQGISAGDAVATDTVTITP